MKTNFELPPPGDWIHFEKVCLKLWGVLWNIPNEIDYNSTNSQGQEGVDIVGIPKGEKDYFGIQCKNKRLHLKSGEYNKISTDIIDQEILKAEKFQPKLKHLIIATSLYKDKAIEIYVREINHSRINSGLFSVQICFWDFISDKIQENKVLTNWYLNEHNLITTHAVRVTLDNYQLSKTFRPLYKLEVQIHRLETAEDKIEEAKYIASIPPSEFPKGSVFDTIKDRFGSVFRKKIDKDSTFTLYINGVKSDEIFPRPSVRNRRDYTLMPCYEIIPRCHFKIIIKNIGLSVIEDYKLEFEVEGKYEEFDMVSPGILDLNNFQQHTRAIAENKGRIKPPLNLLVQEDKFESYGFYVKPTMIGNSNVTINWKLVSRDFNDSGTLNLIINPKYKQTETLWFIGPNDKSSTKHNFSYIKKEGILQPNF